MHCSPRGHKESDTTERLIRTEPNEKLLYREFYSVLCGDLNGKEIQKEGRYVCG